MASLLGAADIVIARAGATTILELAALGKPTILIPNAKLTGGHQIKNAAVYSDAKAVEIIVEEEMIVNPDLVVEISKALLLDKNRLSVLSRNISEFARPNAAKDMAQMIIDAAGR
jgi:UDP-N-acetylglucosamine--N-acetylmuramyl-(pentapeptide) pyrophosphoryl-undecaprenol N-acetylglucosamine transferase